jgi:hypothetical protein
MNSRENHQRQEIYIFLSRSFAQRQPPPFQQLDDMGFLLLSLEYPSSTHKTKFVRKAGPHSNFASPFHKPLAASATDDQWRRVLKVIRDNVTDSCFLHDQSSPRPLKPNDDNYEVRDNVMFNIYCTCSLRCLLSCFGVIFFSHDGDVTFCVSVHIRRLPIFFYTVKSNQRTNLQRRSLEENGNPRTQLQRRTLVEGTRR